MSFDWGSRSGSTLPVALPRFEQSAPLTLPMLSSNLISTLKDLHIGLLVPRLHIAPLTEPEKRGSNLAPCTEDRLGLDLPFGKLLLERPYW